MWKAARRWLGEASRLNSDVILDAEAQAMTVTPIVILLVEDNSGDVLLVRTALREHGIPHELHVISDGQEALRFFATMSEQTRVPDVVLLDLNLPRASGD
jgi:CheY-like chemotaxis protein